MWMCGCNISDYYVLLVVIWDGWVDAGCWALVVRVSLIWYVLLIEMVCVDDGVEVCTIGGGYVSLLSRT